MGKAGERSEYISFAAAMGAASAPLPQVERVRCGTFMKRHPEMIVAWSKFGMTAPAIALQLTRIGMPVSAYTVRDYLPKLSDAADTILVDAIVAQLRLLFMASRSILAGKAEAIYLSTVAMPMQAGHPHPPAANPRPPVESRSSEPLVAALPNPLPIQQSPQGSALVIPKVDSRASFSSAFVDNQFCELASIAGEDEDFSAEYSDTKQPSSFGDLRRSAWTNYTATKRTYEIRLPCGTTLTPPKSIFRSVLDGSIKSWIQFTEAIAKS